MGKDLKGKEIGEGITQRDNGKYYARCRTKNGRRLSKMFDTLSEAKNWLIDERYNIQHNDLVITGNITVDEWFNKWVREILAPRLRKSTIIAYKGRYDNRIKPIIGDLILCDVKPIHCQQVINYSQQKADAYGSVQKIRSIMKAMFDEAVDNEIILRSPVTRNVKLPSKSKAKEKRVLTVEEQNKFIEIGKSTAHYDEFLFILNTGLRYGELVGLQWQDINWSKKTIHIRRTVFYNKELKDFDENPPKTETGDRIIPLTNAAYEILLQRKSKNNIMAISKKDYVFLNDLGNHTINYVYNKCLKKITEKIGVEDFTMHSLRHTFATRCIEAGMEPKVLQKILGHSDIAMTMNLYVHVTEEQKSSEIEKLEMLNVKFA